MNANQKIIIGHLAELQPASFGDISFATRMPTDLLSSVLDDLEGRGFLLRRGQRYELRPGVLDLAMNH